MHAGAAGRRAIRHRSAQIASRRRRLRLIWRKLMMRMRPLHDVEAEEKGEVTAVGGSGKVLKTVNLGELRAQVHLGRVGGEKEQWWYLDFGASSPLDGLQGSLL